MRYERQLLRSTGLNNKEYTRRAATDVGARIPTTTRRASPYSSMTFPCSGLSFERESMYRRTGHCSVVKPIMYKGAVDPPKPMNTGEKPLGCHLAPSSNEKTLVAPQPPVIGARRPV